MIEKLTLQEQLRALADAAEALVAVSPDTFEYSHEYLSNGHLHWDAEQIDALDNLRRILEEAEEETKDD